MRKQPGVPKGRPEKVTDGGFEMDTDYIYFVDKDGDVSRAKRAIGGQKRKKTARKAAKKKVAKKSAKKVAKKSAKKSRQEERQESRQEERQEGRQEERQEGRQEGQEEGQEEGSLAPSPDRKGPAPTTASDRPFSLGLVDYFFGLEGRPSFLRLLPPCAGRFLAGGGL